MSFPRKHPNARRAGQWRKLSPSLTAAQFRRLLQHPLIKREPYRMMVLRAACTGLRSSELSALKWSDVDCLAQHGFSWGTLIDRYIATDMPQRNSTSRAYRWILENYIRPKWGECPLGDITTSFAFETWLNSTTTSEGKPTSRRTRMHIRSLMHILYRCAMRWGLVPITANPFGDRLIRIKGAAKPQKGL